MAFVENLKLAGLLAFVVVEWFLLSFKLNLFFNFVTAISLFQELDLHGRDESPRSSDYLASFNNLIYLHLRSCSSTRFHRFQPAWTN